MTETIKVNFALQPETVKRLERLCKLTYRSKSDVIDYLVAKEIQEYTIVTTEPISQVTQQG